MSVIVLKTFFSSVSEGKHIGLQSTLKKANIGRTKAHDFGVYTQHLPPSSEMTLTFKRAAINNRKFSFFCRWCFK